MAVRTHLRKQSKHSKVDPVLIEKKKIAIELYYGVCYICRKKYGKGFLYHHKEYEDEDLKSDDFASTIWYHCYLLELILQQPERFRLFCRNCHFLMFIADYEEERQARLWECIKETKPRKHVKKRRNPQSPQFTPVK